MPEGKMHLSAPDDCSEHGTMRRYVVTFSRESCFEEGAPGGLSDMVVVRSCDSEVVVSDIPQPPAGSCITNINLYRLESTWDIEKGFKQAEGGDIRHDGYFDVDTQAHWFLVATLPVGTTTIVDSLPSDQLGRLLTTFDFFPPPEGLKVAGITDNGSAVGYVGNEVWFSERNAVHAWPPKSRIRLDHKVKRIRIVGVRVFVATDAVPYVIDDASPECKDAACRSVIAGVRAAPMCSERSIVEYNGDVYWATRYGYVRLSSDGSVVNVVDKFFTSSDWENLNPSTMTAAIVDGVLWASTSEASFYLDILDRSDTPTGVVWLTISPVQWYRTDDGRLMFLAGEGKVMEWDAAPDLMTYRWASMPHEYDSKVRLSAMKLRFAGVCGDAPHGRTTDVQVFADGRMVTTRTVNSGAPFKMPPRKALEWCFSILSDATVREAHLSVNKRGLKGGD